MEELALKTVEAHQQSNRRDKFAAAALTGILAAWTGEVQPNPDEAASVAFIFADAMLEESEK